MNDLLTPLAELARQNPDVAVVWLYGSRAKGNAHVDSDYDLAVAFNSFIKNDPVEKRLRPECLALDWQRALGLHDFQLSVVDINQAPIPLAWEIIQADTVIFCRGENRLWQETLRIHSRMELDYAG
jgi:predicted nucleotidyltransferase